MNYDCVNNLSLYCDIKDLANLAMINRSWNNMITNVQKWKTIGTILGLKEPSPNAKVYKTWKSIVIKTKFCEYCITKNKTIKILNRNISEESSCLACLDCRKIYVDKNISTYIKKYKLVNDFSERRDSCIKYNVPFAQADDFYIKKEISTYANTGIPIWYAKDHCELYDIITLSYIHNGTLQIEKIKNEKEQRNIKNKNKRENRKKILLDTLKENNISYTKTCDFYIVDQNYKKYMSGKIGIAKAISIAYRFNKIRDYLKYQKSHIKYFPYACYDYVLGNKNYEEVLRDIANY